MTKRPPRAWTKGRRSRNNAEYVKLRAVRKLCARLCFCRPDKVRGGARRIRLAADAAAVSESAAKRVIRKIVQSPYKRTGEKQPYFPHSEAAESEQTAGGKNHRHIGVRCWKDRRCPPDAVNAARPKYA